MAEKPTRLDLKRFKIYELLSLVLIALSALFAIMHWSGIVITILLIVQFEVVNYQVALLIAQYKLLAKNRLTEPSYSKLQLFFKRLFLL